MIKFSIPCFFPTRNALLIIVLCFNCLALSAQTEKQSPKNPEAAALAKMIDYPVNNSTGVPNIGISLFDVNSGSLSYSVKLSYHGGGTRVGQLPTWIGQNWSANFAPQITRTVNGLDDLTNGGYLGNNTVGAYNSNNPRPNNSILSRLTRNDIDEQPDEFNYSLLGKSGKFFYQKYTTSTYKALPVPYEQLDIQYNKNTFVFTVTDVDGTRYEFGGYGYIELSRLSSASPSITAWKCSRIISPNLKDTISFEYFPVQTKNRSSFSEQIEVYDYGVCPIEFNYQAVGGDVISTGAFRNHPVSMTVTNGYPYPTQSTFFLFSPPGTPVTYDFNNPNIYFDEAGVSPQAIGDVHILQNIALKKIVFKDNKIEFFPKQQPDEVLDSIRITNYLGEYIRSIKFARLGSGSLDELVFSSGQSIESKYRFEYVPGMNNPNANLPSDAWGFPNPSNGYLNPTTLYMFDNSNIPFQWLTAGASGDDNNAPQDYSFPIGKNNLIPNEEDMKAGALKRIFYPGGGYTEFEFEANRFRDGAYPFDEKLAGGLRIKSIKNFTGLGTTAATEKFFKYASNGYEGAGMVVIDPTLNNFQYLEQGHWTSDVESEYTQGDYSNFQKRTFFKSTIDNCFFSDGSPVNYQEVKVLESENGQQTGMTAYTYLVSHSNFRITNTPLTQHQLDIDNGLLLHEAYSVYDNGEFKWLKTKKYNYEYILLPEKIHVGKAFNTFPLMGHVKGNDPVASYGRITYLSYGLDVGYTRLKKETDSVRSLAHMDHKIGTEKNYYYDNNAHMFPTRIELLNSKKELLSQYTTYPQDYAQDNGMISSLLAHHKYNYPIEMITSNKGAGNKIISATLNTYENSAENYYKKNYVTENSLGIPLQSFKFSNSLQGQWPENTTDGIFSADSHYREIKSTDRYDTYGNPMEFTTKSTDKNIVLWSYRGMYPSIEIQNLDYATLANGLGATAISNFMSSSPNKQTVDNMVSNIKALFPKVMVTSYVFKPLVGMTSMTDSKGITNFYYYDVFQRLDLVKDLDGNIVKKIDYHYKQF